LRWVDEECASVPDAKGYRFMMGFQNNTSVPAIYNLWGWTKDKKYEYKGRSYPVITIVVGPNKKAHYATGDDQLFNKLTKNLWGMNGGPMFGKGTYFQNQLEAVKTCAGPAGLVRVKVHRKNKNNDSVKPIKGTDSEVHFYYPNDDEKRLFSWIVRYNDWGSVYNGYGGYGGSKRDNYAYGGDFNGTMHKKSFNKDTWSKTDDYNDD
jgi:hypothetical protein